MPSTHNATVDLDRMMLLHSVIFGRRVDIGNTIWTEIWNCAKKRKGPLFFPNLITALCRRAGVVEEQFDEVVQGDAAITNKKLPKFFGSFCCLFF